MLRISTGAVGRAYILPMEPTVATIAETIERARASAIPGREHVAEAEVWSSVRRALSAERRPVWRPRRVRRMGRGGNQASFR
jgi:hypothetical protein